MNPILQRLNRPIIVLVAIGALAALLRFTALSQPAELIFDEVYYATDACLYTGETWKICKVDSHDEKYWVRERGEVGSWVHPPMGKWMISTGIDAFGMTPFGWRFAAAVVGTLAIIFTTGMALLLFKSNLWAFIAGVLLCCDGLFLVQSRVALLDIFLAFWVTLGFLFLLLDRRWMSGRDDRCLAAYLAPVDGSLERPVDGLTEAPVEGPVGAPDPLPTPLRVRAPLWRPWRFAAGAAFGCAIATKWSGATALAGALLLAFLWERTRRRDLGVQHAVSWTFAREGFPLLLAFVLVPIAIYLAAYARFWGQHGFDWIAWGDLQAAMADFHLGLSRIKEAKGGATELTHPYSSTPWTWPFLARPVNFYFEGPGSHVLGLGNPLIFWTSLFTVPYAAVMWIVKRDWRAGFIAVAVLSQYLPWILKAGRVQFLFYMTPIVPFIVLAAVYVLKEMADVKPRHASIRPFAPIATGLVIAAIALFAFFYPILTAWPLSETAWQMRMWFPGWV